MGNACRSASAIAAASQAEMRQTGVNCPPPMLMHGGVIRLTPDAKGLFDFAPLPLHDEWLQGRITREEWSALLLSINDELVCVRASWPLCASYTVEYWRDQRIQEGASDAPARARVHWLERGLDLLMQAGASSAGQPPRLYFKVVPIGSSPVSNAAGLGQMSGGAAAASAGPAASSIEGATGTGNVASPPSYPADNAPPGGLNASIPAVASVYAFPIVVKPAPSHASSAGLITEPDDGSVSLRLPASAFRFCPLCAATVDGGGAARPFCSQCGGKWR